MTEPFLFVVGAGRSGTTLLTALLDSHPQLSIPGESGGFIFRFCLGRESWDPHGNVIDDPGVVARGSTSAPEPYSRETLEALMAELGAERRYQLWGIDNAEVVELAAASRAATRADFIRSVYGAYAAHRGKPRFGDKTPDHVLYMRTVAELFPEAIFVHLIRDGRNVALALRDTSFGTGDAREAGEYWRLRVTTGAETGASLGPGRYHHLRYEDLVAEPERELRRICEFAQLPFEPGMLDHNAAAERQLSMSPIPAEDKSLLRPITSGLRDWRTQMSESDRLAFESVAGDTLKRFGY